MSPVVRYTEALKLSAAAEVGPGPQTPTAVCYSNRSLAHLKLQRYPQALADGQECAKAAPSWVKGYFRVGETLRHMGKYQEAEAFFQQAAMLDPTDANLSQYLRSTSDKASIQRTPEFLHPMERALGLKPETAWPTRGGLLGAILGLFVILLDARQVHPSLTNVFFQGFVLIGFVFFWAVLGLGVGMMKESLKEDSLLTDAQKKERKRAAPDAASAAGIFGMGAGGAPRANVGGGEDDETETGKPSGLGRGRRQGKTAGPKAGRR